MRTALVLGAWAHSAPVVAQATGAESIGGALDGLIALGPVGIALVLVVIGWLWPKPAVDRLRADLDRVTKQRDDLVAQQATEVLPVLVMVNAKIAPALEASTAADQALRAEIAALTVELRRLGMVTGERGKARE